MSWRTNNLVLRVRSVGREIGLNQRIGSWLNGSGYEARYDQQFQACIRPGDCVWDIGANIGYYTRLFAERVGQEGSVVAFEPSPVNFKRLVEQCASLRNVTFFQHGLGKSDCKLYFEQGKDELGATSQVTRTNSSGVVVDIRSGDSLLVDGKVNTPNIIKMDVEGFEWDVLEGMEGLLKQSHMRAIGIEVHFGILNSHGLERVPQQIEQLLSASGFSCRWPDSSHILAVRNP